MVVGHRLAPVGHREVRIGLLCLAKQRRGGSEFEVVQLGESGQEVLLSGWRAGVRKVHFADAGRLRSRVRGRGERDEHGEDDRSNVDPHANLRWKG